MEEVEGLKREMGGEDKVKEMVKGILEGRKDGEGMVQKMK